MTYAHPNTEYCPPNDQLAAAMFNTIRLVHEAQTTVLSSVITGQDSNETGHLTPGVNYRDAWVNIACDPQYDHVSCPFYKQGGYPKLERPFYPVTNH
jgi:hypothetical protein